MKTDFTIIISRTDALGDMVLTLPMAAFLKESFPRCKVYFLARKYTQPLISLCRHIEGFIDYDVLNGLPEAEQIACLQQYQADIFVNVLPKRSLASLAKKAGIPQRIGTFNRWYHWLSCNQLIRLSRSRSDLHEAQLNFQLLRTLIKKVDLPAEIIPQYYAVTPPPFFDFGFIPKSDKSLIILHPKSSGNGKEWGIENYNALLGLLNPDTHQVVICGLPGEAEHIAPIFKNHPWVVDAIGRLSLTEYVSLISRADALVASGTGPLHIAAMMGIKAIGLFPLRKDIGPGRWRPLGKQAVVLVAAETCGPCSAGNSCECISEIKPQRVANLLNYEYV
ncbi:glycosyltransferase family 9 protein [Ravibacter arvi]